MDILVVKTDPIVPSGVQRISSWESEPKVEHRCIVYRLVISSGREIRYLCNDRDQSIKIVIAYLSVLVVDVVGKIAYMEVEIKLVELESV